jgi:hypothetical protein
MVRRGTMLAIWSECSDFEVAVVARLRLAIETPMKIKLRLEWKRDPAGYKIVKRDAEASLSERLSGTIFDTPQEAGRYVVPLSGNLESYIVEGPDATEPLALALANAAFSPAGIIEFADSWGLLRWHDESPIQDFHEVIRQARQLLELLELPPHSRREIEWARGPALRTDKFLSDGTLLQEPRTLLDFCKREFAHLASTKARTRRCANCETYFFVKPRSREHYFCQNRCRSASGNERTRKQALAR